MSKQTEQTIADIDKAVNVLHQWKNLLSSDVLNACNTLVTELRQLRDALAAAEAAEFMCDRCGSKSK